MQIVLLIAWERITEYIVIIDVLFVLSFIMALSLKKAQLLS